MRTWTLAFVVSFGVFSGRSAFAQQFSYSPPGYDFGNRYGLNLGYGVGFGYGVGASFNGNNDSTPSTVMPTQTLQLQVPISSQIEAPLTPAQRAAEKQRLKEAFAVKHQAIELRRAKAREEAKERNVRFRDFQESHATRS